MSIPPINPDGNNQSDANPANTPEQHNATQASFSIPQESAQPENKSGQYEYGQYGTANTNATEFSAGYRTVIPMRPLSVGDTLDAVIRLLKFNPAAFILFPLIVSTLFTLITLGINFLAGETAFFSLTALLDPDLSESTPFAFDSTLTSFALGAFTISALITILLSLAEGAIVTIAGTRITIASVRGYRLSLHDAWQLIRPRLGVLFLKIIALSLILTVIGFAVIAIPFVAIVLLNFSFLQLFGNLDPTFSIFSTIFTFAIVIVFGLTIYVRLLISYAALVAEDSGPFTAIKRAWGLTRGSFWHILALVVFTVTFAIIISIVLFFFFGFAFFFIGIMSESAILTASLIIGAIYALLIQVFVYPVVTALLNTIYVNMRFKRENFHQQLLYEASNGGNTAAAQNAEA